MPRPLESGQLVLPGRPLPATPVTAPADPRGQPDRSRPAMRRGTPRELAQRLGARIANGSFFYSELVRARIASTSALRILFSCKPNWERDLRAGFRHTKHHIAFQQLSPDNIPNFDLVMPLTIADVGYLSQVRHLIPDNPIPIPTPESLALCDDKYRFNQVLAHSGFANLIPRMGTGLGFPYILKKKIDEYGINSHMILGPHQERSFEGLLADPEYFCQEVVPGPREYATHIVFKNQRVVCSLNIEYAFVTSTAVKGKDTMTYRKVCPCPHLHLFSTILAAIGFEGLCCINYKPIGNRPFILEINPRFGGSLTEYFFAFLRHLS